MKKLLLNKEDKMIFGVCSGLSDTYGWDKDILRIGFAIGFIVSGLTLPLYIAIYFIAKHNESN